MNELALFAGAGGGILGGKLLGWRTICAVEWDGYARDVLVARQNDGCLDPFPVWDDVQTFDGHPWQGRVDVISGGFPCQDISAAGKGAGIDGDRSSMWKHMARIIGEVRPRFAFVENSPMLVHRGLAVVIGDLAEMGYDAKWGVLGAKNIGGAHTRNRLWILATDIQNPNAMRGDREMGGDLARSRWKPESASAYLAGSANRESWILGRPHGVDHLMDRLKAIGNGQVPAVAALAWNTLTDHRDHTADTNNEQINAK